MTDPTDPWDPAACLRCRAELARPGLPVGARCERAYAGDPAVRRVIDLVAEGWSPAELRAHRDLDDPASQEALREVEALWRAAPR